MGHPYNVAIDMWSLGCMAAELFLGLPLFPGASEHDLLVRVVEMLGPLPDSMLLKAQHTAKYFCKVEEPPAAAAAAVAAMGLRTVPRYQLRSQAEFEALHGQPAPAGTPRILPFISSSLCVEIKQIKKERERNFLVLPSYSFLFLSSILLFSCSLLSLPCSQLGVHTELVQYLSWAIWLVKAGQ